MTNPPRPLIWPSSVDTIRDKLAADLDVYIVGGAVRDAYFRRPMHDLDLATPNDGRILARQIANIFGGDYYSLDAERGIGRAFIPWQDTRLTVDVAQFRGPDLFTDLAGRDFTLNAMAVRLTGDLQTVIDPLGGLDDLAAKRLRRCSPNSIADDPVRILRAMRASITYHLMIDPATKSDLKHYASQLANVSPERVRDEFFHILDGARPAAAMEALYRLGALEQIIPEVKAMQSVEQGPPHQFDVWHHTLFTIDQLDKLLHVLGGGLNDNLTANMQFGLITFTLAHLRPQLQAHMAQKWPNERTFRALLILAALLHDSGKPATRQLDEQGNIHFYRHEQISQELAGNRAEVLRLSNDEISRLMTVIGGHMRPHWLINQLPLTARSIYRFWRNTGPAGVDICLLAMADFLATNGVTLEKNAWIVYLETIHVLLERFFLHYETAVAPPPLLSGHDVMQQFALDPGPQIGDILESVREAQVEGQISTYEEALDHIQRFLNTQ